MPVGFALRRLEVTGPDKPPAIMTFTDGLNVISGPSDTGKTFILQCIDFCVGAGDAPEQIPEAEGYTQAALTIEGREDNVLRTLTRALAGGGVTLNVSDDEPRTLGAKHKDGDTGTVSGYLLDLCGLLGYRVRTHAHGATRSLGFRDISRLTIIDETAVMDRSAPARTSHGRDKTVEDRVFRFVLTGEDDSSVVPDEDPKEALVRQTGRAEVIEQLIGELDRERGNGTVIIEDVAVGESELGELDERLRAATAALTSKRRLCCDGGRGSVAGCEGRSETLSGRWPAGAMR
jgi:hypothetical protein